MTGTTDWGSIEAGDNDNNNKKFEDGPKPDWLDFDPGEYKIRLVGHPYSYHQLFLQKEETGADQRIPVVGDGNPDPMTSIGKEYKERWASNAFLRSEDSQSSTLRPIRFGISVAKVISKWAKATKQNPGGKEGPEFLITISGSGMSKKYTVTTLTQSKFLPQEIATIKEEKLWDLAKHIPPTSHEQMKKIIEQYNLGVVSDSNASMDDPVNDSIADYSTVDDTDIPF